MRKLSIDLEEEIRNELEIEEEMELTENLLKKVKKIYLPEDYEGLENLINLEEIYIEGGEIPEIEDLQRIPKLRLFSIERSGIEDEDIAEIAKLHNLTSIALPSNENLETLHPLENLSNLKELDLESNWQFAQDEANVLEELRTFEKLEVLNISNIQIDNLDFLESLTKLKKLFMRDEGFNSTIEDISVLAGLHDLEELAIEGFDKVEDFTVLKELENLKWLFIGEDLLKDNDQMDVVDYLRRHGCEVVLG